MLRHMTSRVIGGCDSWRCARGGACGAAGAQAGAFAGLLTQPTTRLFAGALARGRAIAARAWEEMSPLPLERRSLPRGEAQARRASGRLVTFRGARAAGERATAAPLGPHLAGTERKYVTPWVMCAWHGRLAGGAAIRLGVGGFCAGQSSALRAGEARRIILGRAAGICGDHGAQSVLLRGWYEVGIKRRPLAIPPRFNALTSFLVCNRLSRKPAFMLAPPQARRASHAARRPPRRAGRWRRHR